MGLDEHDNNSIKIRAIINNLIIIIENLLAKIEACDNKSKDMSVVLNNLHKFINIMNNFNKLHKHHLDSNFENLNDDSDAKIIEEFLKEYGKNE